MPSDGNPGCGFVGGKDNKPRESGGAGRGAKLKVVGWEHSCGQTKGGQSKEDSFGF